jgi:hypothetical protein
MKLICLYLLFCFFLVPFTERFRHTTYIAPPYYNNLWILSSWRNVSNTFSVYVNAVHTSDPETVETNSGAISVFTAPLPHWISWLFIWSISQISWLMFLQSLLYVRPSCFSDSNNSVDFIPLRLCKSTNASMSVMDFNKII